MATFDAVLRDLMKAKVFTSTQREGGEKPGVVKEACLRLKSFKSKANE